MNLKKFYKTFLNESPDYAWGNPNQVCFVYDKKTKILFYTTSFNKLHSDFSPYMLEYPEYNDFLIKKIIYIRDNQLIYDFDENKQYTEKEIKEKSINFIANEINRTIEINDFVIRGRGNTKISNKNSETIISFWDFDKNSMSLIFDIIKTIQKKVNVVFEKYELSGEQDLKIKLNQNKIQKSSIITKTKKIIFKKNYNEEKRILHFKKLLKDKFENKEFKELLKEFIEDILEK